MKPKNKNQQAWFTRPLTPKTLRREAKAQDRLQFKPLNRQLAGEQKASAYRQNVEIPQMFKGYRDQLAQDQGASADAYSKAQTGQAALLAQLGQQSEAARQNALADQAKLDAGVRGVSTSTGPDQIAQAAAARRAELGASAAGMIGAQGAGQASYVANKRLAGEAGKIGEQAAESRRGQGINADLRSLAKDRGAARVENRDKLRQVERDFLLARGSLGQKGAAAALSAQTSTANSQRTAASSRLSSQTSAANAALSQQGQDRRQSQQERWDLKHPGSSGGLTPTQKRAQKKDFADAIHTAHALYIQPPTKQAPTPKTPAQWQVFTLGVADQAGVGAALAAKAVKRYRHHLKNSGFGGGGVFGAP